MNTAVISSLIKEYSEDQLICAAVFEDGDFAATIITSFPVSPIAKAACEAAMIEAVYEEDLRMSLNGYGYVIRDGKVDVSVITPEKLTVFNSYRRLLTSFAGKSSFVSGSQTSYAAFSEAARRTALIIDLINLPTEFSRGDIAPTYYSTVDALLVSGELREAAGQLSVALPALLELPYLKTAEQFELEQQYLGAHESIDSWSDYMGNIAQAGLAAYNTELPLHYQTPSELKALVDNALPQQGVGSMDELVADMDALVNTYSINQSTVNFMAFPESGNSKGAVAAAMLAPLWNQNLISVDKSAPIGTFVEVQVIEWLRKLIGYDTAPTVSAENIGGVTATGGVMSNTIGILVARSLAFPEARRHGLTGSKKKPYLLIADKTLEHYSHKAAFWWLGLGEENIVPVKANGYNFDVEDLKAKIEEYNSGDNVVVAVVCLAGDSRTMTIQNIGEIYTETSKHNIWLHVDACQGGIGIFSADRSLSADYKLADSISIDPHKGLGIPYSSSFCLFKDQEILQHISKSTDITIAKGSYDIGQVTPFLGSRPFDSLKFWALLKYHGLDGLAKNVDYRIALTKEWATFLNKSKYLLSLNDPELTAISFSVDPSKIPLKNVDSTLIAKLNKELHDRCYKAGWLIIHGFDLIDFENRLGLQETSPMRVMGTNFGNVLLDSSHFPKIVAYMDRQLEAIFQELTA